MGTSRTTPNTPVHRRRRRRIAGAAVAIGVFLLVFVGAGTASASTGGTVCAPVRLTGEGVATSPTTTTATIFFNRHPIATTSATFTIAANGTFSGPVVFTPNRRSGGTLVARITGAFGPDFTTFTASGPVTGTGNLSRASGQLQFSGDLRPDNTSFREVVTGKLCVDLSRW